jgi:hypothetical protein
MNQERLTAYLSALRDAYGELGDVLAAFGQNVDLLEHGLTIQSPRSVKRCMNTLSLSVSKHLGLRKANEDRAGTRRMLKELILQYTWGSFFEDYYIPSQSAKSRQSKAPIYHAFNTLEQICLEYSALGDEQRLRFELNRISKQMDVSWSELPSSLARFLGLKPLFFADEVISTVPDHPGFLDQFRKAGLSPTTDFATQDSFSAPNLSAELFEIESAMLEKDIDRAATRARRVIELTRQNWDALKATSESTAGVLGDMAAALSQAPFQEHSLVVQLYDLALQFQAKPKILANNLQRFVGFVVANEVSQLYEVAQECLEKLNSPPLESIRPEFTNMLMAALSMRVGGVDQSRRAVNRVNLETVDVSDEIQFVSAVASLQGDADALVALGRRRHAQVNTPEAAYSTLRLVADGITDSSPESEALACDIYRFILKNYRDAAPDDIPDVEHNLAVHLYKLDHDDEAGRLWHSAFATKPTDPNIRRAYARYLARAKRPDLASVVSRGEFVEERILIPATRELPDRHSSTDLTWLEEKPWFKGTCSAASVVTGLPGL